MFSFKSGLCFVILALYTISLMQPRFKLSLFVPDYMLMITLFGFVSSRRITTCIRGM